MGKKFKIHSPYSLSPTQKDSVNALTRGLNEGMDAQTLLGITGSGKTFIVANVIEQMQKQTLVIAHNKTLAGQLYNEFKELFPDNAVEYFISYYDYINLKPISRERTPTLKKRHQSTTKSTDFATTQREVFTSVMT